MKKIKILIYGLILLLALVLLLVLIAPLHVPRTIQFDDSLPFTEINGYKFHMEIFGKPESTPVIVVTGGPGLDYEHLKSLKNLSKDYRVLFYDQRGAGLSPRVDKRFLSLEQSLDDLDSIVRHFSNGKKVKLIGHSYGGMLVVGYLSSHPEMVSQAVVVEPGFLTRDAAKEWAEKFKGSVSIWDIAPYFISFPFVYREDGQEGFDYVATKLANRIRPGPPYFCEGQVIPPDFVYAKRLGYEVYNSIFQPVVDNPDSFTYDLTNGISRYNGDLMLISTECSILGTEFQEKYHIPKLPAQTIHVKAENTGHNVLTFNPEWSLQTIEKFFKP